MAVLIIDCYIGLFRTGFMQVLYLGRAPRTKETLPDFREECRVTRHSRVFRGLTCDAPKPEGPLTTRQPAEYKWRSGYPTPL